MSPDLHTLTGAYAADALDATARAEFELHLAACEACREEVAGLRETVAMLAVGASVPPPPRLKANVLAEIARTAQLPPVPQPSRQATTDGVVVPLRSRRPTRLLAAAAAVVLVAGLGAGAYGLQAGRQAEQDRARLAAIERIVADPAARTVRADVTGGGSATLVVAGSRAVLLADGLAALPDGKAYQLWVVGSTGIRSAGMGPAQADGAGNWSRVVENLGTGVAVAVSVEPEDGSPQPTTDPVVALQV